MILKSKDDGWRTEVAPARINVFWNQIVGAASRLDCGEILSSILGQLVEYVALTKSA